MTGFGTKHLTVVSRMGVDGRTSVTGITKGLACTGMARFDLNGRAGVTGIAKCLAWTIVAKIETGVIGLTTGLVQTRLGGGLY